MNKKQFIKEVARRCMLTEYTVDEIYNVSFNLIAETLISKEEVEIPKFGKFILREKNAKNLLHGNKKEVSGICVYPSFKISNGLKNRVKNGHKYPKK